MRILIITIVLFVLPLKMVAQNPTIFLNADKSYSIDAVNPKQDKRISHIVKNHTKGETATFIVRFIGANTDAVGNAMVFRYKEPELKGNANEDAELQTILHVNKVKRKRKSLAKRIIKFINEYKAEAKYTNIVNSIVPISKATSNELFVYYFTDGIESSKDYRMLDVYPFKSVKHAIEAAKKDAVKLKSKYGLSDTLHGIKKIVFFIPVQMDHKKKGSDFIEEYFSEIFRLFQVRKVEFNTF